MYDGARTCLFASVDDDHKIIADQRWAHTRAAYYSHVYARRKKGKMDIRMDR